MILLPRTLELFCSCSQPVIYQPVMIPACFVPVFTAVVLFVILVPVFELLPLVPFCLSWSVELPRVWIVFIFFN